MGLTTKVTGVRVDLTVRLGRGVEGVEHTANVPWFDEQQCCIDAPR